MSKIYKNMKKKLSQTVPSLIDSLPTAMRDPTQSLHQSRTTTHDPGVVKLLLRQGQGVLCLRRRSGLWERLILWNGEGRGSGWGC